MIVMRICKKQIFLQWQLKWKKKNNKNIFEIILQMENIATIVLGATKGHWGDP
jgi:hypothetical protein